jgi:hypothetical protein
MPSTLRDRILVGFMLIGAAPFLVMYTGGRVIRPIFELWEWVAANVGPAIPAGSSLPVVITTAVMAVVFGLCVAAALAPVVYAAASKDKFALLFSIVALSFALYQVATSNEPSGSILAAIVYLIATVAAVGAFAIRRITVAIEAARIVVP